MKKTSVSTWVGRRRHRQAATVCCAALLAVTWRCADSSRPPEMPSVRSVVEADVGFYQEVSWSPDGAKLLVSVLALDSALGYTYRIHEIGADGSGYRAISEGPRDLWTSWSPNRRHVAFNATVGDNTDIFVMNADGTGRIRLTSDPADDVQPSFSPDGLRIAFVSRRGEKAELFLMNADSTGLKAIGGSVREPQNPRWSPDGVSLVYYESGEGPDEIFAIDADGSGRTRIGEGVWPSWSPDGERILFARNDGLYTMAGDGSDTELLIPGAFIGEYSPDGRRIGYIVNEAGVVQVFLADADGSNAAKLLERPAPQW
jgi:Tol biopolymer transport system component